MGLSIKNPEVERLARELAVRRNISITEAIRQSLEREVRREAVVPRPGDSPRFRRMLETSERASKIPRISDLTDDEILGYDDVGAPTR